MNWFKLGEAVAGAVYGTLRQASVRVRDPAGAIRAAWIVGEASVGELREAFALALSHGKYDYQFGLILPESLRRRLEAAPCATRHLTLEESRDILVAAIGQTEERLRPFNLFENVNESIATSLGMREFLHLWLSRIEDRAKEIPCWFRKSRAEPLVAVRDVLTMYSQPILKCVRRMDPEGPSPECEARTEIERALRACPGLGSAARSIVSGAEQQVRDAILECLIATQDQPAQPVPTRVMMAYGAAVFRDAILDEITSRTLPSSPLLHAA